MPPHRPERRAGACIGCAMTTLAAADQPSWSASDIELNATGPSYTFDTLTELHAARAMRRVADFFHHRRRCVRRNCHVVALSCRPRPRTFRRRRAARNHVRLSAEAIARPCRRMTTPAPVGRSTRKTRVILIEADDARCFVDRDSAARSRRREHRRPRSRFGRVTSRTTILYARVYWNPCMARPQVRGNPRTNARKPRSQDASVDEASAKAAARRELPKAIQAVIDAAQRQEGDGHRGARSAEGGRVHGLLRDLLGRQSATGAGHCRRGGRGAQGAKQRPSLVEGYARAEWVLLDYFDFVVHVFSKHARDFYGLDRLWGNAARIELPDVA